LLRALVLEPNAAVAFLDREGRITQASVAFAELAGAKSVPRFGEPMESDFHAAVRRRQPFCTEAQLRTVDSAPLVSICLTPLGIRHPAFMLRLGDLGRVVTLQAELAQAQRLQSVGLLAAGIAHDFNNLLTVILGAADAMAEHINEAARDDLAQIRDSAARGAALVQKLLAFGRQQTLQPRVLSLNDAIRQLGSLLGSLLGSRITLQLELEEPGRNVRIDPTQLDRVLINLASNARDAMAAGGTFTIATARRVVLESEASGSETLPAGRYAVIEVRDTGGGIPPETLPRIFEPFFTTRRDTGGNGLGLASVHGIVKQSGGTICVDSQPGQGTCFRITLPRCEAAHNTPAQETQPAHAAPTRSGTLLLVDDEDSLRRLAARALTKAGWHVLEAASGEEALELDVTDIELVISDVMMPGLDGPGLVKALRARMPGLRAILVSGYADAAKRRALLAQDIEFLAKPFAMNALVQIARLEEIAAS
jgi:two-component system cell cycle sensor histidine kinase/response regulator CckA